MSKLVVLSGAGISAESGLKTFREAGGLWEGHDVTKVASPQGWYDDPEMVLEFYNQRRKHNLAVEANDGHKIIAELEKWFDVVVITQNVDNLHEKAGSSHVIHLHGQLFQSRSTADPSLIYEMEGWELNLGDKCEKGSQLRPNIVWFGEPVPLMDEAIAHTLEADIFIVIGTSLQVYPAAGLVDCAKTNCKKFVIDPNMPVVREQENLTLIQKGGSEGMMLVKQKLLSEL
ncbi:MAG: NAD-dependent deacylase [Gammaproteobacteria bacterium]|nr:NAD-dependent deacylase [Gammaproteobacteria bacterium]